MASTAGASDNRGMRSRDHIQRNVAAGSSHSERALATMRRGTLQARQWGPGVAADPTRAPSAPLAALFRAGTTARAGVSWADTRSRRRTTSGALGPGPGHAPNARPGVSAAAWAAAAAVRAVQRRRRKRQVWPGKAGRAPYLDRGAARHTKSLGGGRRPGKGSVPSDGAWYSYSRIHVGLSGLCSGGQACVRGGGPPWRAGWPRDYVKEAVPTSAVGIRPATYIGRARRVVEAVRRKDILGGAMKVLDSLARVAVGRNGRSLLGGIDTLTPECQKLWFDIYNGMLGTVSDGGPLSLSTQVVC
ncbi:hypothetical protein AcV7_005788 [Taiwanofungus camphoratus]|nr:hypothetical protein AcV7_005788 [Antrodia cinnamomea]